MPKQSLDAQIAVFDRIQPELRKRYGPHEWVVIANGELKDHFSEFADAARYADQEFGSSPALIRQIESEPVFVPYLMAGA